MENTIMQNYGTEKLGCLKKAMLHCPELSLMKINQNNFKFYLFDNIPNYEKYIEEHRAYSKLLTDNGVQVYELSNFIVKNKDLMSYLPDLAYLNDISVITRKGAYLSSMSPGGRQYEEIVVGEALTALGIPILRNCTPGEQFEGFLTVFSDTLFVADTERHSKESIERFLVLALQHFEFVIYAEIPQSRRFMHPDMIFGRISDNLGLFYPPAFLNCWLVQKNKRDKIDFAAYMKQKNMELIAVSDEEQQKWATSFITLEPCHIINYDISLKAKTQKLLESKGVRFTQFHPDALLAGGGSLRCLTLCLLFE
jgi:arginine deiminase